MLMAAERDAEARVAEEREVEHRVGRAQLPAHEGGDEHRRGREAAQDERARPAPLGRLDDAVDERDERGDGEPGADEVEAAGLADRGSPGRDATPARMAMAATGTLTRKTDVQENHSSSSPPNSGPRPMPIAAMPAQIPIALPRSSRGKTFVMIDRVAGMMSAPPTPIAARIAISWLALSATSTARLAAPKIASPGLERALAPEAVAERAHGQEQAGEDEQVGVDDPLQRRVRRVEVLLQARQGDVEDRVVEPDDHEAQREHREGLPAARVAPLDRSWGRNVFIGSPRVGRCEQDWIELANRRRTSHRGDTLNLHPEPLAHGGRAVQG